MSKEQASQADNKARIEHLMGIVLNLPDSPGCYQYLNEEGTIIYVGKAKKLKRRVLSYFNKEQQSIKTKMLVRKIWDIKYIVVQTEEDALLLENNLIKKYNPHYNVLLKDGKTYPSICISNELYPRIFKTRNIDRRMGTFYGPYSHQPTLNALLELIKKLYRPRTCHLSLTPESIQEKRFKVCLEYHIKHCKAPCIGEQSQAEYANNMAECREILKGNTSDLLSKLMTQMEALSNEMRFEEAFEIKQKYDLIDHYRAKSEVVSNLLHNIDVFSINADDNTAYINYLHVTNGCINQAFTFEYKKRMNESLEELLTLGIIEMRARYKSLSREIILPLELEIPLTDVHITVPQKGEKKKLLDLSQMNVKQYKFDRLKQADKLNPEQKAVRLMKEIQDNLKLPKLPIQIECFDNSNLSGTDAVAACVVFRKLKPAKKEYRKYTIKTVIGPDDYASMKEVVRRRYTRLTEEQQPLPDLIITDGGKGQMETVRQVIQDELHLDIPIAGLAKDNRHRTHELLYGFPPATIGLNTNSQLFKLLTQLQDEVHRFAITFHRDKRSKRQTASELDEIKGIGETTKKLLIRTFGSVKQTKEATKEQLQELMGKIRGAKLYENLHSDLKS
ncbi:MAG: excinuclease ABC subunit UvrC [Bacteroidaceae bacterium]